MPEETNNQTQSTNPPTWADFKPPVTSVPLSSPSSDSSGSNPVTETPAPNESLNPDQSPSTPETPPILDPTPTPEIPNVPTTPDITPPPVMDPITSPTPIESPVVTPSEPTVATNPVEETNPSMMSVPEPVPNPTPVSPEPTWQPTPTTPDPLPPTEPTPDPATATSETPTPITPNAAMNLDGSISSTGSIDSPEAATPSTPSPVTYTPAPADPLVPMDPMSSATPMTPLAAATAQAAPISPATVPQEKPKRRGFHWPLLAGGALVIAALGFGGYYIYANQPKPALPAATLGDTSVKDNLGVLASAQGPDTWENNFSSGLLATERSGMEMIVTDPPAATDSAKAAGVDLASLKVKIAKVEAHLVTRSVVAQGVDPSATKSANKSDDHWETLRLNADNTVDLMSLRNQGGALQSLGVTYLAAGHYTELRVFITSATAVGKDGTKYVVNVSDQNGVLKIAKPFDLTTAGPTRITADFNAPGSVVKSGYDYELKPVLSKFLVNDKEI